MGQSNPDETSATQQNVDSTLEGKVKAVIGQFKTEEDGSITFPDELKKTLDADTLYAATAEHRRRSTQSGYTKGQQTIQARDAEIKVLQDQLAGHTQVVISDEDQAKLDILKTDDPDKWRQEFNRLETAAKGESSAKLAELTGDARKAADLTFELDRRQTVLDEFNASAEVPITAEVIANDVPPRITKQLEDGSITWEKYLVSIDTYLKTGKVIKQEKILDQPDMGKMGGSTTPSDMKPEKSLEENYGSDIY